jgi:putative intracellular protease/amidase
MSKRVLMIATSNTRMGDTGKTTGIWAEELAVPYYQLVDAGAEVEIASPLGGEVTLDPGSVKAIGQNAPLVDRLLTDPVAQAKIRATHTAAQVDASGFDAIFFPGGHGTMWDLPNDAGVTRAVEAAFAAGKTIASVCHGGAGLVSARRADGESVVKGKRINAFTNAEEDAVGLSQIVPFQLETRLRALGAQFEGAANWQAFAVADAPFITGQNPQSSALVAQLVLKALNLAPEKLAA